MSDVNTQIPDLCTNCTSLTISTLKRIDELTVERKREVEDRAGCMLEKNDLDYWVHAISKGTFNYKEYIELWSNLLEANPQCNNISNHIANQVKSLAALVEESSLDKFINSFKTIEVRTISNSFVRKVVLKSLLNFKLQLAQS